jgi:hypothetical protein
LKQHLFSKWSFVIPVFAFLLMGFASQGPLQFPTANPMDFTAGRVRIHVVPIAIATEQRFGGPTADGTVLRIEPAN